MSARLTIVALACLISASALAVADDAKRVNVQAGNLIEGLESLAKQCGVDVIYPSIELKGLKTRGVSGTLAPKEAFKKLIEGTPLILKEQGGAVLISLPGAPARTQSSAATEGSGTDAQSQEGKSNSSGGFLMAQANPGPNTGDVSVTPSNEDKERGKQKKELLEEVIVTGTHLRDTTNPTAPLNVITRDDIEHAGFTTTQQLTASLPQNYSGGQVGASEDGAVGSGFLSGLFSTYGTALNLRGLGESSTLVLVNGHRLAPSADGLFVDVSTIPLAAIDRVEVVTDGASAVYGSDAVAGVVNFILRKNYDGQETWVNYAPTFDGSRGEQTLGQSVGRSWTTGNVVATLEYQKQDSLNAADRSYTDTAYPPTDLLPKTEQYSGVINFSQDLGSDFELSSDILFSHKTAAGVTSISPADGGYTQFNWNTSNSGVASINLDYKLSANWHIDASTAYARETTAWDFAFVNDPSSTCPSSGCEYHDAYSVWSGDLSATGVLFHMPGGDVKLALGGTYRNESIGLNLIPPELLGTPYSRHVFAEYAELEAPLVSGANAQPLLRELVLSLAVRHDEYSDFGSTTNPRYGLAWKPVDQLRIRGAYSTSFRAPTVYETLENSTHPTILFQEGFASPSGQMVPVFNQYYGGPPPGPERSSNITAGLELELLKDKELKASIDYFDIRYRDRIVNPQFPANVLSQLSAYGPLVSAIPSDAAAQAYYNQITSTGGIFANFSGLPNFTGVRYLLKSYEQNAALVTTSGLDFALNDRLHVGANEFRLALNATYLSHIDTSFSSASTSTDLVNTYANPLHWRARGQVTWTRGEWSATSAVNFTGRHDDTTTVPIGSIASWTTFDAQVAYTPMSIKGLTVSLSALNVFDRDPPYVAGSLQLGDTIHYEVGNANPLGRQVILGARLAW